MLSQPGGHGAVRELADLILAARELASASTHAGTPCTSATSAPAPAHQRDPE